MPWNQNLSEFDSTATTEEEQQTPETTPRAWWLTAKERTVYRRSSFVCVFIALDETLMWSQASTRLSRTCTTT